ncbi:MAG: hypothetical protein WD906_07420 [Anaerolineales bacterium]
MTSSSGPKTPTSMKRLRAERDQLVAVLLGVGIGILLASLCVLALYSTGYVSLGGGTCPGTNTCPATPSFLPVCPTCAAPPPTVAATATPTTTLTPTPDFVATSAAQACATFVAQFPGTPCP